VRYVECGVVVWVWVWWCGVWYVVCGTGIFIATSGPYEYTQVKREIPIFPACHFNFEEEARIELREGVSELEREGGECERESRGFT